MGTEENKKTAVSMWTTLSAQVMTASLAVIAVEGAFITFVLDKWIPSNWFYLFLVLSVFIFIFSILNGGVGISRMAKSGYQDDWSLDKGTTQFRLQALSCLFGFIFFFISVFFIGSNKEEIQKREARETQNREANEKKVNQENLQKQIEDLNLQIKFLTNEIETIKKNAQSNNNSQ